MSNEITVDELIELLSVFPGDKPVKIMGWYSIRETDEPEEINEVCYLREVDDTFEVIDVITDFVAIVTKEYDEIAKEWP